jgi:hypothetical protein
MTAFAGGGPEMADCTRMWASKGWYMRGWGGGVVLTFYGHLLPQFLLQTAMSVLQLHVLGTVKCNHSCTMSTLADKQVNTCVHTYICKYICRISIPVMVNKGIWTWIHILICQVNVYANISVWFLLLFLFTSESDFISHVFFFSAMMLLTNDNYLH